MSDRDVVSAIEEISRSKSEPEWMRQTRLRSLRFFDEQSIAGWSDVHRPKVDLHDIIDDVRAERQRGSERDEVTEETRLDVSEAERESVGGVTARDESEAAHHRNRVVLEAQGVVFCDMDTAVREYPHLVEEYFGTVVPFDDNKFAALNASVWSGGSFVYVPPGVDVDMALQAFSRINSESAGRFERTLIVADEGSNVHYIEGCSAPVYTNDSLRASVVEVVVKPHARVTYTAIQNWSPNVYNLVTKRAHVEAHGHIDWVDGNIGSKLTTKCPAVRLVGEGATCVVRSLAYAGEGQQQDAGAEIVHAAPNTTSNVVSKSISQDGGIVSYRGAVRTEEGVSGTHSHVQSEALLLDADSIALSAPNKELCEEDGHVGHEATLMKIANEQLFYLMSRGLSEERAVGVIVNGFIEPITNALPMEYAIEWSRLIELQLEGSVG